MIAGKCDLRCFSVRRRLYVRKQPHPAHGGVKTPVDDAHAERHQRGAGLRRLAHAGFVAGHETVEATYGFAELHRAGVAEAGECTVGIAQDLF